MPALHTAYQPRILWNIKANEVLVEALKLSPKSDHNRRWMARLEEENRELKSHSTLYEPFQLWCKYDPNQPRVPAGNPDGGQWTDGGGGGGTSGTRVVSGQGRFGGVLPAKKPDAGPKAPDGTPVQLVQSRGSGRRGGGPSLRRIANRDQEITPAQEVRLSRAQDNADAVIRSVQQGDPNWRPQARLYENVESEIAANESIRREAEERLSELSQGVNIRGRFTPYGFVDQTQCTAFGSTARNGLAEAGIRDASIHLRGSAVTGRSYRSRALHDGAKRSDIDVAIASETLLQRAEAARVDMWGKGGTRTEPIYKPETLERLGLLRLKNQMEEQTGREVSFVIFRSREDIRRRGEFATLDDLNNFIRKKGN